jgi:hypothetical protein
VKEQLLYFAAALCLIAEAGGAEPDRLDILKLQFARADCVSFQFLSIVESGVFERSDTAEAEATIAEDGRYLINLGRDQYLYDLEFLYSFSSDNNQLTIDRVNGMEAHEELSFVKRLDEFYRSFVLKPDSQYRLLKSSAQESNIPDSLLLFLRSDSLVLDRIEYYDINEELNRIIFLEQIVHDTCQDLLFAPDYPDSVEVIRLF